MWIGYRTADGEEENIEVTQKSSGTTFQKLARNKNLVFIGLYDDDDNLIRKLKRNVSHRTTSLFPAYM